MNKLLSDVNVIMDYALDIKSPKLISLMRNKHSKYYLLSKVESSFKAFFSRKVRETHPRLFRTNNAKRFCNASHKEKCLILSLQKRKIKTF